MNSRTQWGRSNAQECLFDIASMIKPVTAIATMMLAGKKRLLLDTPTSKFLPNYKNPKVRIESSAPRPARREITVRDLLNHTSGINDTRSHTESFRIRHLGRVR
ncbi:MAG: Esterase EstB [Verrucomicrobia subdivision 3 bacterium]|nr:Esterase EstB [Limisphaerales bacterium]MCS1413754.1 Esterase EstB [Limisphaerales bacterium]